MVSRVSQSWNKCTWHTIQKYAKAFLATPISTGALSLGEPPDSTLGLSEVVQPHPELKMEEPRI